MNIKNGGWWVMLSRHWISKLAFSFRDSCVFLDFRLSSIQGDGNCLSLHYCRWPTPHLISDSWSCTFSFESHNNGPGSWEQHTFETSIVVWLRSDGLYLSLVFWIIKQTLQLAFFYYPTKWSLTFSLLINYKHILLKSSGFIHGCWIE